MNVNEKFFDILKQLEETQSIVEKRKIFNSINKTDRVYSMLQTFFQLCYDKNLKFGIKNIPDEHEPSIWNDGVDNIQKVFICVNNIISGPKKITPTEFFESLCEMLWTEREWDLLERILARDPRCNVGRKLYEEFFEQKSETEFTPKCMKANSFSEKNMKAIKYPCLVQKKLDGARCLIHIDKDNEVNIYSGNGKHFQDLKYLEWCIKKLNLPGNILDGEMLVFNKEGKPLSRKEGNGILNKSGQGTISQDEANQVGVVLWDIISEKEYKEGKGITKYNYRFAELADAINETEKTKRIFLIESQEAKDESEVMKIFTNYLTQGEEGVIVKNYDHVWENKRSKYQVKFKQELIISLEVIGIEEGAKKSKYEGMIGALSCQSSDGKIKVNVGSGLTDEDRNRPSNYFLGEIIDVKCNGVIQSKADKEMSLFLPRFIEKRIDKFEADSTEYICQQDVTYQALNK